MMAVGKDQMFDTGAECDEMCCDGLFHHVYESGSVERACEVVLRTGAATVEDSVGLRAVIKHPIESKVRYPYP